MGRGHNDLFGPEGGFGSQVKMTIYDRWGNAVFDCNGSAEDCRWDGRTANGTWVSPGVYVYRIAIISDKGETVQTGDVTLLR